MRTATLVTCLGLSLASACTSSAPAPVEDPEDSVIVDDDKADNYFSASALEYTLTGKSTVVLDASMATASEATRMAAAKKLISEKQIAIAWFITQYLVDKDKEDDANYKFGGFGGMAKGGMWDDLGVTARADKLTYDFTFKQIAAGGKNLISRLPIHTSGGKQVFDLDIGRPTNEEMGKLVTNEEWYRQAPWDAWDPTKATAAQKETIAFAIAKAPASTDAFWDMKKLTADGKLDVDVFFGWDYHSNYHLKHSKEFFGWLEDQGYKAPVASWDKLTRTSGAFTKHVTADGKDVAIEVRIFFGKPGTETDPDTDAGGKVLENDARASLAKRDVVIYSGHSGPFYGFALANWKMTDEGDLDDADIRAMTLPSKYQIVLAEGCDTYQIGEAFLENPGKAGKNVNVLTTTSFSNAATPATVEDFMSALVARDSLERLRPQSQLSLLTKLDSESADVGFHSMYGVHGIDEDPTLHPFAVKANFGTACKANADCGGPGNLCVTKNSKKSCTAACTADAGCGTGWSCKAVASASTSTIYGRACAKNP